MRARDNKVARDKLEDNHRLRAAAASGVRPTIAEIAMAVGKCIQTI